MKKKLAANSLLLLAALIWGCAFVSQAAGMDYTGPFTFNAARSYLGALVLLPVIGITGLQRRRKGIARSRGGKTLWLGGIVCGLVLFAGSSLQQVALCQPGVTAGKAGFITALYIVLVPICSIFLKKRPAPTVWISVALATAGLYFLCMTGEYKFSIGDVYLLLCAGAFTLHILVIDRFSPRVDGVCMSCIQFFVSAVLCTVAALLWETPRLADMMQAWLPIGFAGIMSSGVAYTLQIVGQKNTEPTVASLLLSLESVFAVLAGMLLLHERMSGAEILGCVLMFAAIILAQIPADKFRRRGKPKAETEA